MQTHEDILVGFEREWRPGAASAGRSAPCTTRANRSRHRGAVYIFVLATALLVSLIAIGVLTAAQVNGRVAADMDDSAKAAALAESAVEFALQAIANDANWRSDYPAALPVGPLSLGEGTISFTIVDDVDGNLTNNSYDSIRIVGTGRVRKATRIYSVQCKTGTALDCLQISATVGGTASLGNMALSGPPVLSLAANAGITAQNVNFANLTVLQSGSAGNISTTNCSGIIPTTANGSRQLPDPAHVCDYYLANATAISIAAIPLSNGIRTMQLAVLSSASNPYGVTPNAQGIYVIDCLGQTLQIENMRVVGTLVIVNPGSQSGIRLSNYFAPAVANFPSLLVLGDFTLGSTLTNLSDNPNTGAQPARVNYNPLGTPYLGAADNTYTTSYPSRLDGIVYVSQQLTADNAPSINGVLIAGGNLNQNAGALNITYNSTASTNPPPGFTSNIMIPVSGTWQWEKAR